MRPIDADALYRRVKAECNPYGKPSIGWEDGQRMMQWIERAPTIGSWINVEERLPEEDETVLVYIERAAWGDDGYAKRKKEIAIGWQIDGRWHVDGCMRVKGLYWMPLPGPPEEVSGDGD